MVWCQVSSVSGMSEEEMEVEMKERGMKVGKNADRNREVKFLMSEVPLQGGALFLMSEVPL